MLLLLLVGGCSAKPAAPGGNAGSDATTADADVAGWEQQAARVEIIRDDWGVPHVYGKTDADAVFGMIYAQAEDDFNRIEMNYLNAMGRLAEAEGESAIWRDLRMKLFIDPAEMQKQFKASPAWLQTLMHGVGRRPELLPAHAPGGEAESARAVRAVDGAHVQRRQHRRRHREGVARRSSRRSTARWPTARPVSAAEPAPANEFAPAREPTGSNGFAIAPQNTAEQARPAADQPAHLVLLPRRSADGERGRPECVRRGDLGPVLHLSGLQRQAGLDAHVERRGRDRRVSPRP